MRRFGFLLFLMIWLAARSAAASPVGKDYWLTFGPFLSAAWQFQAEKDEAGEPQDAPFGGGLAIQHNGMFAYGALIEGDYLPVLGSGLVRGELRVGFLYLTLGAAYANTFGDESLATVGPTASLDWPIKEGASLTTGAVHVLSLFYRMDLPVGPDAEDFETRHQIGIRFIFDSPFLLELSKKSYKTWWGPEFQHGL